MKQKTYLNFGNIRFLERSCGYYQSVDLKERLGLDREERTTKEYQLDYITEGTAKLIIDGVSYSFEKNSVCFRKPGQNFSELLDSPYSCYALYFNIIKRDTGELINFSDQYTCFLNDIPTYIPPEQTEDFYSNMKDLFSCYITSTELSEINSEILMLQMIKKLFLLGQKEFEIFHIHPAVRKATAYLRLNSTTSITTEELAKHVNLEPSYFHKLFKKNMGMTPYEYIMKHKLNFVKRRLLETNDSIADIAYLHGFSSLSYFSYVFKKQTGLSPSQFRQSISTDS